MVLASPMKDALSPPNTVAEGVKPEGDVCAQKRKNSKRASDSERGTASREQKRQRERRREGFPQLRPAPIALVYWPPALTSGLAGGWRGLWGALSTPRG